jgi:HlyD family secretion protein
MRFPRWILWALAVAAALAAALLWPKPPVAVRTVRVARGQVEDVVTSAVAGEIKSAHQTQVRAEIAGTVVSLKAQRGNRVEKGQLIVSLDPADLDARISQARGQIDSARAALAEAQAQESSAEPLARRMQQLLKQGAATEDAADKASAGRLSALAAEASARAQISEALALLQLAEIARKRADIRAPFAGALQQLYPEVGADMVPGSPIFDILDTTAARIETTIDEADASRVELGQPAEMTLDAYPGVRFKGKVSLIAPAVAPDPRLGTTRSLPIWVAVDPDPRLRIGMSSTVEIIVAHKENVLNVPSQTVIGRGVERDVYRVVGGVAHKISVQVGISNWDRTEITSGLAEGDAVVTSLDAPGLMDGVRVATAADAGS